MSDTLTLSNPKLLKQQCLVKDSWQDSSDGATIEVTNPFSGQTIGTIPIKRLPSVLTLQPY